MTDTTNYCKQCVIYDERIKQLEADREHGIKANARLKAELADMKECEICDGQLPGTGVCLTCWNKLGKENAGLKKQVQERGERMEYMFGWKTIMNDGGLEEGKIGDWFNDDGTVK